MAKKNTSLDRETGTVDVSMPCPNCGATLTKATQNPDGALAYEDCKKCHNDPEKADPEKAELAAQVADRELGTNVKEDS